MKLNPDCIRDLLMEIEYTTDSDTAFTYSSADEYLKKYDKNEVYYHFRQADLSGFLYKANFDLGGNFYCTDLSPKGHQFLNDIRSDSNWKKTKDIASSVGSFSLNALTSIASQVIAELINNRLSP